MKINSVIKQIKEYYRGLDFFGNPIDEAKTRDQILFGDANQECTGIITTCYCSMKVIQQAKLRHANLIICHESAFWNRGTTSEKLEKNETLVEKKRQLADSGIVVWRNHDYIHSGMPLEPKLYTDGIFYGFMKIMGWEQYMISSIDRPMVYDVPEQTAKELGEEIITKLHLQGIKVVGDPAIKIKRVMITEHILGEQDHRIIERIEENQVDCVIALECIDFTVASYIKDSAEQGRNKILLAVGHFNVEEPGMNYLASQLPTMLQEEIPAHFVQSGDMYNFIVTSQQD